MILIPLLLLLILLIAWGKITPFLAFLITSITTALVLGISPEKIPATLEKGIGSTMGSMAALICLGAMFGKIVAESGAAQKIALVLMRVFGKKYMQWAMVITGFIVGIPLFYNVGFVLLVPLVFALVYQYKLPAVYIGLPLLASLSVTHGFLPPHPAPTALIPLFGADIRRTLWYGILIAIPAVILAGPLFARTLRHIDAQPLATFRVSPMPESELPGTANSFITALLPILLLVTSTVALAITSISTEVKQVISMVSDPVFVLLFTLFVGVYTLGSKNGKSMATLMNWCNEAIKDIAGLLFIIAGAGALKQVLVDSGVSTQIGASLQSLPIHPLALAWGIATLIRVCVGSATVAGMTAAGIVAPLAQSGQVDPNLLVLAVGAGSLMLSHVNDSGFWLYKTYFNLSLKDTFLSWTIMETIVGLVGLVGVLLLDWVLV
jgi:Gnt-I system high-affinity gluconate transporter